MIIKKKTAHSVLLMYDVLERVWPVAMLQQYLRNSANFLRTFAPPAAVYFVFFLKTARLLGVAVS